MTAPAAAPGGAEVQIRGLTRVFGDRTVLTGLDLDIRRGEFVALIGHSGCGKTTLLRLLAGLDRPDGGTVRVPPARMVVFQEHRLLPWRRVWRNVAIGLRGKDARAAAVRALAEVGLADHVDSWPRTLSGGEAQRVALARALVREPQLLLLDEPFAALDALTRIKMHALVRRLIARQRPAVLLVTHDVDEAILLADRVVAMRGGRLAAEHPVPAEATRRGSPEFARLRAALLAELGVEEAADDVTVP
ncbi:aliphatic sulfonate ABC transporter ATP-binding protein [Actinomadura sp. NBRC 104425]|uniref:ABC transporter ATP-binding protein n=1 Tax=Actinomadura sp. NBRC 104425 TaxID=3032204 RepID=UPI0024A3E27A|nr:ABC transporter ATP-binding protein [Actinomadura sp. NBRC 104425]GLZ13365.1 aliphatic sulfonate ABC transporter ATP-binding protein [Actinomadura sp. NBRC 104425]